MSTDDVTGVGVSLFAEMLCEVVAAAAASPVDAEGNALRVEQITVDTPVEISLASDGGTLSFDASGPSQTIETSVLPVFHRIRAMVARVEQGDG